ncbi:MAG: helix-turn-helix domain-containing protein [Nitrospira sp.]|nr:helix-turn-helix domain-containing protein [Nitrospira sp.]
MGHYHRLTLMEREELSRMLAAGSSLRATAHALQRALSTLSRKLTRHRTSPATYRAVPAHQRKILNWESPAQAIHHPLR